LLKLPLSSSHWWAIIALDLLIKVALSILINPFMIVLSIPSWILHLSLLASVNWVVRRLALRPILAAGTTIVVTNFLFSICFVFFDLFFHGHTGCVRYVGETEWKCDTVNGHMTWVGIRALALTTGIVILTNVLSLTLVWLWNAFRTRTVHASRTK
jgi:hypothetical protein